MQLTLATCNQRHTVLGRCDTPLSYVSRDEPLADLSAGSSLTFCAPVLAAAISSQCAPWRPASARWRWIPSPTAHAASCCAWWTLRLAAMPL